MFIAFAVLSLQSISLSATPVFDSITTGTVTVDTSVANKVTVNQQSNNAEIAWSNFNIDQNQQVDFRQPSSQSLLINNILDQNPSQILGTITANGRIVLLNANGFYFGINSSVSAHSFIVAATSRANVQWNEQENRLVVDTTAPFSSMTLAGTIQAVETALYAQTIQISGSLRTDSEHPPVTSALSIFAKQSITLNATVQLSNAEIDIFSDQGSINYSAITSNVSSATIGAPYGTVFGSGTIYASDALTISANYIYVADNSSDFILLSPNLSLKAQPLLNTSPGESNAGSLGTALKPIKIGSSSFYASTRQNNFESLTLSSISGDIYVERYSKIADILTNSISWTLSVTQTYGDFIADFVVNPSTAALTINIKNGNIAGSGGTYYNINNVAFATEVLTLKARSFSELTGSISSLDLTLDTTENLPLWWNQFCDSDIGSATHPLRLTPQRVDVIGGGIDLPITLKISVPWHSAVYLQHEDEIKPFLDAILNDSRTNKNYELYLVQNNGSINLEANLNLPFNKFVLVAQNGSIAVNASISGNAIRLYSTTGSITGTGTVLSPRLWLVAKNAVGSLDAPLKISSSETSYTDTSNNFRSFLISSSQGGAHVELHDNVIRFIENLVYAGTTNLGVIIKDGNVFSLTQSSGNIILPTADIVYSGVIGLTARTGSILANPTNPNSYISAPGIILRAPNGQIGTSLNPIHVANFGHNNPYYQSSFYHGLLFSQINETELRLFGPEPRTYSYSQNAWFYITSNNFVSHIYENDTRRTGTSLTSDDFYQFTTISASGVNLAFYQTPIIPTIPTPIIIPTPIPTPIIIPTPPVAPEPTTPTPIVRLPFEIPESASVKIVYKNKKASGYNKFVAQLTSFFESTIESTECLLTSIGKRCKK